MSENALKQALKQTLKEAFGYIRVSHADQLQGDGPDRQRDAIRAFCRLNGLYIADDHWFMDDCSGTIQPLDRPRFSAMIGALNGIKTIVCESYGRASRNADELSMTLIVFKQRGYELLSATEPNEVENDPVSTAMRQILAAFHQLDRALLRKRTSERIKAKMANDPTFKWGRRAYGTQDNEKSVLIQIFELRGKGLSTTDIAKELNDRSVPTREGRGWKAGTVHSILRKHNRLEVGQAAS